MSACWNESVQPNCALPVCSGIPGCITEGADGAKAWEEDKRQTSVTLMLFI